MKKPHGPLARPFQSAAVTLAARHGNPFSGAIGDGPVHDGAVAFSVPREGVITGHSRPYSPLGMVLLEYCGGGCGFHV